MKRLLSRWARDERGETPDYIIIPVALTVMIFGVIAWVMQSGLLFRVRDVLVR